MARVAAFPQPVRRPDLPPLGDILQKLGTLSPRDLRALHVAAWTLYKKRLRERGGIALARRRLHSPVS